MPNYKVLERFRLTDGQFYALWKYKNLHWELDGEEIGYGDLRDEDIVRIAATLKEDEEFVGWNEHHGSQFQQTNTPMVRIAPGRVIHREEILRLEGR